MNQQEKLKKGQKLNEKAILLESSLAAAKLIIGFLSQSTVLISDALHSTSDLISIFTSWFGLKISQKKPDEKFPYGYYKAENLGTLLISLLIFYASWEMFSQGCQRLTSLSPIKIPLLALTVSLLDAFILFFFGCYEIKIGRQINAQSLIAIGQENRTHLFSSLAVFTGILATLYQIPYMEGLITIIISLLIFKIGTSSAKNSVLSLMDVRPSKDIEEKTAQAVSSVTGIEEILDLKLRQSGPFIFGETKVGIRKYLDVQKSHLIAEKVEKNVQTKVPQIASLAVHVEPFQSDYHHLVIPVSEKKGLLSSLSKKFGRAPYFLFINLKGKKIKGHYFLKNPYQNQPVRAGLSAAKLITNQKSDTLLTHQIGEIAFNALRENLFDFYQTKSETAQQTIKQFNQGKLQPLSAPTKEVTKGGD